MRFSIVVPVYNVEKYLGHCVDSLLAQTFTDYEVILVDDGSTDGSSVICDEYVAQYPDRVRVIHQRNRGLLMARRVGFAQTVGDIVLSVDSDDALQRDALKVLDQAFARTGAQMVCYEVTRDIDFAQPDKDRGLFHGAETFEGTKKTELYRMICGTFFFNNMWSKAVSRDILGIDDDYTTYEGLSYGEDVIQVLPMLDRATKVAYIPEILYFYRLNADSLVHRFNRGQFRDLLTVRQQVMKYAEHWERNDHAEGLTDVARTLTLHLIALQLQDAAESLPSDEMMSLLTSLDENDVFRDACMYGAIKKLRPDMRVVVWMARHRLVKGIRAIALLKTRLLGRNRY